MKHFKMYFHLYILTLLIFTFCLSVVIETIFKIDFKDCLMISISFLGLFATFGGAYLGAKISGDNARTLERIKRDHEIEENVKSVKVLIKMNFDNLTDIHMFICEFYCIDRSKLLSQLIEKRKEIYTDLYRPLKTKNGDFKTINFIETFMSVANIKKEWNKDIYNEIDDFGILIKEISRDLVCLKEEDLNIIFQLKQVLLLLRKYIYFNKDDNDYFMPREGQEFENVKGSFILFSILYIDLSEKILNIDVKKSLVEKFY
ncbi:hypothetical protein RGR08_04675 [Staphylococcus epidermidis]|uniref:hypothetical protein n=1 Tax=Staphylococcus epidermidis TaxID=1282 RepID=UPI00138E1B03